MRGEGNVTRRTQRARIEVDSEAERETEAQGRLERDTEAETRWMEHYGAKRRPKGEDDNTIAKIITHNINSFPKLGAAKFLRMQQELRDNDIIGMSETNKNWNKMRQQDTMRSRTDHWWKVKHTQMAWLRDTEWPSTYQQGGVTLTTQGELADFVQEKGEDQAGLGRWAWQTLEGREETKTAIIQIYRPCKNTKDAGSTYQQQQAWTDEEDLLKSYDNDLLDTIDTFRKDKY